MLAQSPTALLVRWTDGFQPGWSSGKWYSVICRQFQEIEQHDANNRRKIRKALKECTIEKSGRPLHRRARLRHILVVAPGIKDAGNTDRLKSKEQFQQGCEPAADFSDIIDFWAIF